MDARRGLASHRLSKFKVPDSPRTPARSPLALVQHETRPNRRGRRQASSKRSRGARLPGSARRSCRGGLGSLPSPSPRGRPPACAGPGGHPAGLGSTSGPLLLTGAHRPRQLTQRLEEFVEILAAPHLPGAGEVGHGEAAGCGGLRADGRALTAAAAGRRLSAAPSPRAWSPREGAPRPAPRPAPAPPRPPRPYPREPRSPPASPPAGVRTPALVPCAPCPLHHNRAWALGEGPAIGPWVGGDNGDSGAVGTWGSTAPFSPLWGVFGENDNRKLKYGGWWGRQR